MLMYFPEEKFHRSKPPFLIFKPVLFQLHHESAEQGVACALLHGAGVAQEERLRPGSGISNQHVCVTWDVADEKPV